MNTSNMKHTDKKVEITRGGDLSIQQAAEFKDTLIKALASSDHIILKLSECTGIDLSCIQLICAAHRTALNMNKVIELGDTLPDIVAKVVESAGYFRDKGCSLNVNHTCLWTRR